VSQTNVIIESGPLLLFTLNLPRILPFAYHITEELTFYADRIMVMGNSKNLYVFNFAILLKSQKIYAREIYVFYSICNKQHLLCTS